MLKILPQTVGTDYSDEQVLQMTIDSLEEQIESGIKAFGTDHPSVVTAIDELTELVLEQEGL